MGYNQNTSKGVLTREAVDQPTERGTMTAPSSSLGSCLYSIAYKALLRGPSISHSNVQN